jgi:type I restriction enzyme, S subunit
VFRMPNLARPVSLAMNLFLLRTDQNRLDQTYAYYWLKANEAYVKSFTSGAAAATITKKAVRELTIPLPNVSVQRRIAGILQSYDDLIENTRRRIRTLEAMARALYHEWFVEYRFPNHERLEPIMSSADKIPKNWEVRKVAEFGDFVRGVEPGSAVYSKEPAPDRIKFLRVGDLSKVRR